MKLLIYLLASIATAIAAPGISGWSSSVLPSSGWSSRLSSGWISSDLPSSGWATKVLPSSGWPSTGWQSSGWTPSARLSEGWTSSSGPLRGWTSRVGSSNGWTSSALPSDDIVKIIKIVVPSSGWTAETKGWYGGDIIQSSGDWKGVNSDIGGWKTVPSDGWEKVYADGWKSNGW